MARKNSKSKFGQRFSKEEKLKALKEIKEGKKVKDVCKELGICSETIRNWTLRYKNGGEKALEDKKTGGAQPSKLGDEYVGLILSEKAKNPMMGIKQLSQHLKRYHEVKISPSTISSVFEQYGVLKLVGTDRGDHKALGVFQRPSPQDLWQADFYQCLLSGLGTRYILGGLDDRSRFLTALESGCERTGGVAIAVFEEAFDVHGVPGDLLTDRGPEFVGSWNSKEISAFREFLESRGVQHITARSHRPTTLGKMERLWQTLERELLKVTWFSDEAEFREKLDAWRRYYNYERPHQALMGKTPAEVYFAGVPREDDRKADGSGSAEVSLAWTVFGIPVKLTFSGMELRVERNQGV